MFFNEESNIRNALHGTSSILPELISVAISQDEILAEKQQSVDFLIKKAAELYELDKSESKLQVNMRRWRRWMPKKDIMGFLTKSADICKSMERVLTVCVRLIGESLTTSEKIREELHRLFEEGMRNEELEMIDGINEKRLKGLSKIERILSSVHGHIGRIVDLCKDAENCKTTEFAQILKDIEEQKRQLIGVIKDEVRITSEEELLLGINYRLIREEFDTKGIFSIYEKMKRRKTRNIGKKIGKLVVSTLLFVNIAGIAANSYLMNYLAPWIAYETHYSDIQSNLKHMENEVTFKSTDGITLNGSLYLNHRADPKKVIVILHEFSRNRTGMLPAVKEYVKSYNVLIYDARGVGENEYGSISGGYEERKDLAGALDFLASKGFEHAVIHGVSMGAATAVFAASEYQSNKITIEALILQSIYANFEEAMKFYNEKAHLPQTIIYPSKVLTETIRGMKLKDISPEREIASVRVPILLVANFDDEWMDFHNSRRVWERIKNRPNAEKLFLPGNLHADFRPDTMSRIQSFIQRYF